jgi:hypothetical protein
MNADQMRALAAAIQLREVSGHGWRDHSLIGSALAGVTPNKAEWRDQWMAKHTPAPRLQLESSYDDCVEWSLNLKDMSLEIRVFDGDAMAGQRTHLRCTWVYLLNAAQLGQLPMFEEVLRRRVLSRATQDHLDAERLRVRADITNREAAYLAVINKE